MLVSCSGSLRTLEEIDLSFCEQARAPLAAVAEREKNQLLSHTLAESRGDDSLEELLILEQLANCGRSYRLSLQAFAKGLKSRAGQPVAGADQYLFSQKVLEFAYLSRELIVLLEHHSTILNQFERESEINRANSHELMLCLAVLLQLYDNSQALVDVLNNHEPLRLSLRQGLHEQNVPHAFYQQFQSFFYSPRARVLTRDLLIAMQTSTSDDRAALDGVAEGSSLQGMVTQSLTYSDLINNGRVGDSLRLIRGTQLGAVDFFTSFGQGFTRYGSMLFGNCAGIFHSRQGKLLGDSKVVEAISAELQPLDILLHKTPFRLTDSFIPGYFSHVAIYTGTKQQLLDLGLWNHPHIKPYQQQIENGATIIEALRPGVSMNSVEGFMNIDDLLVCRRQEITETQRYRYLANCFRQLGKQYDFNFNVEESRRIVCSEMIYHVFTDDPWFTQKAMGRYTICPDHVIKSVLEGKTYREVLFYHDAELVPPAKVSELLVDLLDY